MTDTDARLIERQLREAIIQCGRAAGALLTDDVSNEFLAFVPGEVKARIESLTAAIEEAKVLIGARNDNAPEAIRQSNINAAWHKLDDALGDSK